MGVSNENPASYSQGGSQGTWYQPDGTSSSVPPRHDDGLPQGTFINAFPSAGPQAFPSAGPQVPAGVHAGHRQPGPAYPTFYPGADAPGTYSTAYVGPGPQGGASGGMAGAAYLQTVEPNGHGGMVVTTVVAPAVDAKTIQFLILRRYSMMVKIFCIIDFIFSFLYLVNLGTLVLFFSGVFFSILGFVGAWRYNKCLVWTYAAYTMVHMVVTIILPLMLLFFGGMSLWAFLLLNILLVCKCCVLSVILSFVRKIPPRRQGGFQALKKHVLEKRMGRARDPTVMDEHADLEAGRHGRYPGDDDRHHV